MTGRERKRLLGATKSNSQSDGGGEGRGGYFLPSGENEKIFTKSAFLPWDFAKYVRNQRWDLRGVGHLFFLAIENAGV